MSEMEMDWPYTTSQDKNNRPNGVDSPSFIATKSSDQASLNSEEDHAEKLLTRNLDGIREEQGIYGLPEVEVSPDYETDEDIPIKGATLPYNSDTVLEEDTGGAGSETGFSESGNFGSASSDPPLSAKSTADVLEEGESLDDFVRREKEIAQELEESGEFAPGQLQQSIKQERENLQQTASSPQGDQHHESDYENDSDYPEGLPLDYPKDPPPAYTSPRKLAGPSQQKPDDWDTGWDEHQAKDLETLTVIKRNSNEEADGWETSIKKPSLTKDMSSTSSASGGIGSLLAAGGVAAAVAGKNVHLPTASFHDKEDEPEDSEDDMDYYTDNIRDDKPNSPEKQPETLLSFNKKQKSTEIASDMDDEDEGNEKEEIQQHENVPKPSAPVPEPEPEIKYLISNELRDFLHLIEDFAAERIEIESMLKPFLLDFIPAVGDVDPFIKIPRPDEVEDNLGLIVLDEPAASQSDPTIITMQLQQSSNAGFSDAPVKKVVRADKNTQQIEKWIENIKELRRGRPPDRVSYGKPMPDIEKLMQEWNPEMEDALKTLILPTAKLDASLEEYADLCLGIVDIPVQKSRIHSLHLLFSLYNEFKNSQHFRNLESNNLYRGPEQPNPSTGETNRLELL